MPMSNKFDFRLTKMIEITIYCCLKKIVTYMQNVEFWWVWKLHHRLLIEFSILSFLFWILFRNVAYNPWECNCELYDFVRYLKLFESFLYGGTIEDRSNTKCATSNTVLLDLEKAQLCKYHIHIQSEFR